MSHLIASQTGSLLKRTGALLERTGGHFVGTSGVHTDTYINCDVLFSYQTELNWLCQQMALLTPERGRLEKPLTSVDVVIGVGSMGRLLAYKVAEALGPLALPIFAEKRGDGLRIPSFFIGNLRRDTNVLIVDDAVNTGKTLHYLSRAVTMFDAKVIGISTIASHGACQDIGGVTVNTLYTLRGSRAFRPDTCLLCEESKPIWVDVGHGQEFYENHKNDMPSRMFLSLY